MATIRRERASRTCDFQIRIASSYGPRSAVRPMGRCRINHRKARLRFTGELRMAALTINGKAHQIDVDPNTPLLWVIREQVGLTGTKYGCGIAQCGACTVHVEGVGAVRSCSLPVSAAEGMRI